MAVRGGTTCDLPGRSLHPSFKIYKKPAIVLLNIRPILFTMFKTYEISSNCSVIKCITLDHFDPSKNNLKLRIQLNFVLGYYSSK